MTAKRPAQCCPECGRRGITRKADTQGTYGGAGSAHWSCRFCGWVGWCDDAAAEARLRAAQVADTPSPTPS